MIEDLRLSDLGRPAREALAPAGRLLRYEDRVAVLDPNSTLFEPVSQIGNNLKFVIKSGSGPHTSASQGAAVIWKAKDVLRRPVSAPLWFARSEILLRRRQQFDSGLTVETGICYDAALLGAHGAGLYTPTAGGAVLHYRDVPVVTGSFGNRYTTRAQRYAIFTADVNKDPATRQRHYGSIYGQSNGGRIFDSLTSPNTAIPGADIHFYVAVYGVTALGAQQTVVVQPRGHAMSVEGGTWQLRQEAGQKVWAITDSVLSEVDNSTNQLDSSRQLAWELLESRGSVGVQAVGHLEDSLYASWFRHSGVGGSKVSDAIANFDTYLAGTPAADIVVLSFGVNDAVAAVPAATFKSNYQTLIGMIQAARNPSQIKVCYPTPNNNAGLDATLLLYEAEIDALTGIAGSIDMRTGFVKGTMLEGDGTHLNLVGHQFCGPKLAAGITLHGE